MELLGSEVNRAPEALRRRAAEGGSYRVVVSLTRTVLWLLSLGIFDKEYAAATAGSSDEHTYVAADLFTAETPLGTYQRYDRPGGHVANERVIPNGPGAARFIEAAMAGTVNRISKVVNANVDKDVGDRVEKGVRARSL
jgi:hypothetical protein